MWECHSICRCFNLEVCQGLLPRRLCRLCRQPPAAPHLLRWQPQYQLQVQRRWWFLLHPAQRIRQPAVYSRKHCMYHERSLWMLFGTGFVASSILSCKNTRNCCVSWWNHHWDPEGLARLARPGDTMGNASANKICGDCAVQHKPDDRTKTWAICFSWIRQEQSFVMRIDCLGLKNSILTNGLWNTI